MRNRSEDPVVDVRAGELAQLLVKPGLGHAEVQIFACHFHHHVVARKISCSLHDRTRLTGRDPIIRLVADGFSETPLPQESEQTKQHNKQKARAVQHRPAAAQHLAGVRGARHEAAFLEHFFHEQIAQEVRTLPLPAAPRRQFAHRHADGRRQFLVQRRAFAHGGGEVNAAQEERLGRPFAGHENRLQVTAQARPNGGQAVRQREHRVHLVGAAAVAALRHRITQQTEPPLAQTLAHGLQMLIDQLGPKRRVERLGIRPAHHLVLELRVGDVVEKFAEAGEQVALGDDDIDREPHVEHALNHVELLRDLAGLLQNFLGGIFDQILDGDGEEESVDRAVGPGFFQQGEELAPLAGLAGADFLEHELARRVENDRVVREPPVHVDGAAHALQSVLHSGRETDVAPADGLGLARAGRSADDIPRELVEVLAA